MKKIAILIALAAFAATPAVAASKKKPQPSEFDQAMAQNEKNLSLVVQALPLVLPTWSLPIWFNMNKDADQPAHGKKKKKH